MTPAEEDALVESAFMSWLADGNRNVYELMRLAIRAAYAQGREDAAKIVRESTAEVQNEMMKKLYSLAHVDGAEMLHDKIIAAIRRGD